VQNLYHHARNCFLLAEPDEKLALTREVVSNWKARKLTWQDGDSPELLNEPGRLNKPEIVAQKDLPRRRMGSIEGKASMIHALAHIELTAVNLSWDAIYRYRDMPREYYDDWVISAGEEATHFLALRQQLRALGFDYGDFPAHEELWKMAITTADDVMHRMGIVHRVFEGRALDVVPRTMKKFEAAGDKAMVDVLTMIANEEVGHVSAATRWFRYRCKQEQLEPDATFFRLIRRYMPAPLKGPFNRDARLQAGFSDNEVNTLIAEDY
jgi:uncharacterized ferritin-like protein (DUF455 family)